MIQVKNLCFDYPGKRALDNVSFEIAPKTITALVGPNGAGKTTILRCLAALDFWTSGEIYIDNIEVEHHPREIHKICSYLSDFFGLYDDLTVKQSLIYIALSRGAQNINAETLALDAAQNLSLHDCFEQKVGNLSRGLRQRVAIAQTIVVLPKILILDEPASGLDPEARLDLSQLLTRLQEKGLTILVSSHILAELEDYCTHMIKIMDGKIVNHYSLRESVSEKIYELKVSDSIHAYLTQLNNLKVKVLHSMDQSALIQLPKDTEPAPFMRQLMDAGVPVESFSLQKQSMQEVYMQTRQKDTDHDES